MTFKDAVEATAHLDHAWKAGLKALRARDRRHIQPESPPRLRGSVDVDAAMQPVEPQANRWDLAIAYQHANRDEEVVYWVELHSAETSEVDVVIRKAQWLLIWLQDGGKALAEFERDVVWVSSGPTRFTLNAPQKKRMAEAGLRQVGGVLRIRDRRPPV
jgi:hypothetical protein